MGPVLPPTRPTLAAGQVWDHPRIVTPLLSRCSSLPRLPRWWGRVATFLATEVGRLNKGHAAFEREHQAAIELSQLALRRAGQNRDTVN